MKKLNDRKFRRQHSIGYYIVDFYCSSEKLIIEQDSKIHLKKEVENNFFFDFLGSFERKKIVIS